MTSTSQDRAMQVNVQTQGRNFFHNLKKGKCADSSLSPNKEIARLNESTTKGHRLLPFFNDK
jgi:hypothetical protein